MVVRGSRCKGSPPGNLGIHYAAAFSKSLQSMISKSMDPAEPGSEDAETSVQAKHFSGIAFRFGRHTRGTTT